MSDEEQHRDKIQRVPPCNHEDVKIYTVKKDGPNFGRKFSKCKCGKSFKWVDENPTENEAQNMLAILEAFIKWFKENKKL